jgi:hypothetical protein
MKEESKSVRISAKAYEDIIYLQEHLTKVVGFVPSITQIIEYAVSDKVKHHKGEQS